MTDILDRWNTHYTRCHTITDSEALGQELAQEVERLRTKVASALECLDGEPEYHDQGMGCGLEDRNITDRYEAMSFGWEQAIDRVYSDHVDDAIAILQHDKGEE